MSAGIKANLDGSGAIQVGGVDYIGISSAGAVSVPQSLTVTGAVVGGTGSAAGNYVLTQYVSPSPWVKSASLKAVRVTVIGGGGTGGLVPSNAPPGTGN